MTGADPVNVGGADPSTPSLRRRLACFAYEGVLLFGVLFVSDYLFSSLTQQRHALQQRQAGMAFLFVVLGVYFVWFWSHGGQTLAMKTWHLRVVDADGTPPRSGRALVRYAAAWLWFLPPLAMVAGAGFARLGGGGTLAIVSVWLVGYAALSRVLPGRQLPHDVLSGTRLLTTVPPNR
jgi:uncharacterized RDD family membrane protein YckC